MHRVGSKIKKMFDANVLSSYHWLLSSLGLSDEAKVELAFHGYAVILISENQDVYLEIKNV